MEKKTHTQIKEITHAHMLKEKKTFKRKTKKRTHTHK
jgi:hypothetical protein